MMVPVPGQVIAGFLLFIVHMNKTVTDSLKTEQTSRMSFFLVLAFTSSFMKTMIG